MNTDLDIVLPLLYVCYRHPDFQGWAYNALGDIQGYVGFDQKAWDTLYGVKTHDKVSLMWRVRALLSGWRK